jgi:DNA-binding CsgD family transcriptional regulator
LVAAQLIIEESAERFAFRHALTHETVYTWLLQRERRALHERVAEILERTHADRLDMHESELAYHYFAAEVWAKAFMYSQQAGIKAQAMFAPREAIEHLTHALEAARQLAMSSAIEILRARGKAYETVGDFERARVDYEEALNGARQARDRLAEWQQLIDLGFLWASRDYARTGEHFQQALALAQTLGDPAMVGHSLNRLGNWYANVEQASEGLRYHQEALGVFESLNDSGGLAETLDLLGMTSQLNSQLIQSHSYYQRVIRIARDSNDRWGLAAGLACLTLCAPSYLKILDVPAIRLVDAARGAEEAVKVAHEIDWRVGESFTGLLLAMCLGPQGEYRRALEVARASLTLAEEIEHRQWIIGAHTALGLLHLDLLAFGMARLHLEKALVLAREVGSQVWADAAAAYLVTIYAAQGEFERAEALLHEVLIEGMPMQTQRQRLCWYACGELALIKGEAETALDIANKLIASAQNLSAETVIPHLWQLRGEALAALGKRPEAEAVLQAAQTASHEQGAQSVLWRLHIALCKLYQAWARRGEAQTEFSAAQDYIHRLAANVPDDDLRREFVSQAMAMMPHLAAPSPRQIEKKKFGGLSAREREVAALIGQGRANREIATELVVGIRTVEAHITRILNKLGFSSRTQIAVWAAEQGLTQIPPKR